MSGRRMALLALLVCLLAGGTTNLFGQRTTQLSGRIADPTGAVVPGATVVVIHDDTKIQRDTTSNELGYYTVPLLQPGRYRVTVRKEGFRPVTRSGITLEVDQAARVDFLLEVGTVTETVEVTANVSTVDTHSVTLKEVIDQRRIRELPLNGRDPTQLILLLPGVYGTTADASGLRQGGSGRGVVQPGISSNGARGNMVNYGLDGAFHNDTYTNVALAFPNPDALQEFSVQTNNFSAEHGRSAGAVVSGVTRSGGNQYHGSLFEFHRNEAVNARNFFATAGDGLKRNQFGGTFGGPVRRDKTFFFFSYQETRQVQRPADRSTTVLTEPQRRGDFSARRTPITDPLSRQPFPGNLLPISRLNVVTRNVLDKLIPLPTEPDTGLLRYTVPNSNTLRQMVLRLDHNFGPKDTLTGRYLYNYFYQPPYDVPLVFATQLDRKTPNHNLSLTHTHTFRPNLLNQLQFSLNRRTDQGQPVWKTSFVDLGMRNVVTDRPNPNFNLNVTGAFAASVTEKITTTPNAYTVSDLARWTAGRHEASFGFEYRKQNLNKNYRWLLDPAMRFEGDFSGFGVSDFFLGLPSFLDQMAFGEVGEQEFPVYSAFAQDNIKVTPKFTVNLGVRYEPLIPYTDKGNRVSVFRPGAQSQVFTRAPKGLLFVGDPGVSNSGTQSDLSNFAPRVGFAWAALPRTSIRSAYGIFYDSSPMSAITNVFQGVAPFGTRLQLRPPPGPFDDPYLGNNPFPLPFPPPRDVSFPDNLVAATFPEKFRAGYLQSWHLTIERELFTDWVVRAAYAGSKGTALLQGWDLNAAPYVPGRSTRANVAQRRPYGPAFGTIRVVDSTANSSYNSLQLSLDKRFSRGFTILANYTWAKSIDYGSGGGTQWCCYSNPFYFKHQRGLSDFHHEHRFVTSWLWELPRLTAQPAAARFVLGAWSLSGALTLESGAPFSIVAGQDNSLSGVGSDRADLVGDPSRQARQEPNRDPVREWFNTRAFAPNREGTFGTAGRNIVFGPGLANVDVAVAKYFPVTEALRVQFRSEFFNLFNRANFGLPSNSLTSGTYGRITAALDPRILQFGLKLQF